MSIFQWLKKPTLKVKMIAGGSKVKVKLSNANPDQTMILLYMAIQQIARGLKVDHRHFLNKLIDLDKRIVRNQKDEVKQAKYGKKK